MLILLKNEAGTELLVNTDHIIHAIPTDTYLPCRTLLIMDGDDNLLVQQSIHDIQRLSKG